MHSSQRKLGLPVGKHEGIVPRDFERVLWLVKDKIAMLFARTSQTDNLVVFRTLNHGSLHRQHFLKAAFGGEIQLTKSPRSSTKSKSTCTTTLSGSSSSSRKTNGRTRN